MSLQEIRAHELEESKKRRLQRTAASSSASTSTAKKRRTQAFQHAVPPPLMPAKYLQCFAWKGEITGEHYEMSIKL
jgi:hypothetical protein